MATGSISKTGYGVRTASDVLRSFYQRAPASVMTFGTIALSYCATKALEDYRLYKTLGQGGLGAPSIFTWLANVLVLRHFALPQWVLSDPACLPLDDEEWAMRLQTSASAGILEGIPQRKGERPRTAGLVPHRQIESIAPDGSELQAGVISHLETLARRNSNALTLDVSAYEGGSAPCLFVRHEQDARSVTEPTTMARFYISGTPGPATAANASDMHEVAHVHRSDGSMHLVLSPQDCRIVLDKGWGELHRLAGMAYRGHYFPPYWLPRWLYRGGGAGEARVRWSYQRSMLSNHATSAHKSRPKGRLPPPTYVCVYAPRDTEELQWIQCIIDSSISWSLGRPV